MNRIDFHSIATILLGGLIDADYSQMDFIYMLFGSFANDNVDFAFDNGLVCKWIKGSPASAPKLSVITTSKRTGTSSVKILNQNYCHISVMYLMPFQLFEI